MSDEPENRNPNPRVTFWRKYLETLTGCEGSTVVSAADAAATDSKGIGKVCAAFGHHPLFPEKADCAVYLEGEQSILVAIRTNGDWITAKYNRPIELGYLHSKIEKQLEIERNRKHRQ